MSFLKEYTILAELGQGGFAKVYKVRHNALDYIRAIRVLNETVTDENSKTYQKFLRECKVLLRLGNGSHPNIVHIYQPRFLENHALVEMDFVDGMDLLRYLKANGNFLPADEVLRMVEQMSSALAYCHEDIYKFCMDRENDNLQDDPMDGSRVIIDEATRQRLINKYKVIHNDIHSANIMRREDGSFVLLDFGLAITGGDDVCKSSRHENGAVEYKAPEKWDKESTLTEQSDIYSFGVVMYEYLAGRVPFPYDKTVSKAEAEFKLLKAHLEQKPQPIEELRGSYFEANHPGQSYEKDYPEWLEEAIMKCLEKDPDKRFRNGKQLHAFVMNHIADDEQQATHTNQNDHLPTTDNALQGKINELMSKNMDLAAELEQTVKHDRELEATIKTLKEQAKGKKKTWAAILAALFGLMLGAGLVWALKDKLLPVGDPNEESTVLQLENDSLRLRIDYLEDLTSLVDYENLEQKENEIDSLQQHIKNLEEQISQNETALADKENEIAELQEQQNNSKDDTELIQQLTRAQKERDDYMNDKESLESTVSSLNMRISNLQSTIAANKKEITNKENQILLLNEKLKECIEK